MRKTRGDGHAMLVGCGVGAVGGVALGGVFSLILGDMQLWLKGILLLHTAAAMAVMGAWTMPCLMASSSSTEEL